MIDREKVIRGLEWILDGERFGFGVNWTEDSEPKSEEEQAGYNIQRAIELLKEQEQMLKEQEAEIAFLKAMQLQTIHNMSDEDIGNAVRNVLRL